MDKKSTIRELIEEAIKTVDGDKAQIEVLTGRTLTKGTCKVHILDYKEVAVVFIEDEPAGLLVVDWSEPCLEFKPI